MDELRNEPGHNPRNLDPKRKPDPMNWLEEGIRRQRVREKQHQGLKLKVCHESRDEMVEDCDACQ